MCDKFSFSFVRLNPDFALAMIYKKSGGRETINGSNIIGLSNLCKVESITLVQDLEIKLWDTPES